MVSSRSSAALRAASWSRSIAPRIACSASLLHGVWRPANARSAVEETAGDTDVIPGRSLPVRVAQQRGGVIGDDHRNPPEPVHAVAERPERLLRVQHGLRRGVPHREDHLRLEEVDLAEQIGHARRDLVVLRRAILARAALDHVADEHLLALELDGAEDLGQQLPRLAHERPPRFVLRPPGPLPDHDEPRVRRPRSEEHTSELQSRPHPVCRLLLAKKNKAYDAVPLHADEVYSLEPPADE